MNTIPITFDEHQINRTVLGGRIENKKATLNISVILMNSSGNQFKTNILDTLLECGFRSIVSIELDINSYTIDDISKKYPAVKFIIPLEETTDGEMINLAMAEIEADYVLILRNNLYLQNGFIQENLAERIIKNDTFCIVPRLIGQNKVSLASQFSPGAIKNNFVVESSCVVNDGTKTLYPLDNIAIYNRKKFIELGGFDWTIKSKHWQNLDLGLRSWLWGEKTLLTTLLQFTYIDEAPIEDKTVNLDYLRCYLKNELPKIKNEYAYISSTSFLKFFLHSSCGYLEARRQFSQAVNWVNSNKLRFKKDLQTLITEWTD